MRSSPGVPVSTLGCRGRIERVLCKDTLDYYRHLELGGTRIACWLLRSEGNEIRIHSERNSTIGDVQLDRFRL
jgi:hypothetical protein